jgi:hypothetical protein
MQKVLFAGASEPLACMGLANQLASFETLAPWLRSQG